MKNILLLSKHYQKLNLTLLLLVLNVMIITPVFAQDITISGVVNSEENEPLPGVTILVQGTTAGTVTDINGNYKLQAPSDAVLDFSFIGYLKQSVSVGGRSTIDISLSPDIEQLEEVVVIGYGTQKKSHLTGAISKVENTNIDQIPTSRADQAMVGRVAGMNVQSTSPDGVGGAPTIQIRGVGSITGGSGPLLVIDGIAVDSEFWSNIDMNDVASIEVLKDAASAAIFGSRGANGVVMITTKSGESGKTKFSYNGFYGWQDVQNNPDYNTSVADGMAAERAANGELSDRSRYKELIGVDNNWQDIIFDGGNTQSHTISARGGNESTTFSTAMTYAHDEGVLLTDDFKKYNFKAKVDTKVNDDLSFGVSLNPSYTERRRFDGSTHDILRQTPWLPVYHDENTIQYVDRTTYPDVQVGDYALQRHFDNYDLDGDGTLIDISNTSNTNPAAKVLERDRTDLQFKMFGKFYTKYKITDDLSIQAAISGDYQNTERKRYQGVESNRNGASAASLTINNENKIHIVGQSFVNYSKTFGDHDISGTAGIVAETFKERYTDVGGTGYEFDYVPTLDAASTASSWGSREREKRLLSFIGRVNYSFADKYLASISLRRDGSSVFGSETKYGNFPAASVGWRISEEAFLAGSSVLSNLKVRASYGITGNDQISTGNRLNDWYSHTALLSSRTAVVGGGTAAAFNPQNIANPELGWERSIEINPGIDFGFLDNRISGSVDVYRRTSDDLLLNVDVSGVTGFNNALVNIGEVKNEGIEVELRTTNLRTDKFKWTTTVLASKNKNTLTDFADSDGLIQSVDSKRAAEWISSVGDPISSFYGYVVDRQIALEHLNDAYHPIGAQAQDVYVRDLNGDGVIDDSDKTILGNPYPDFIWSITNTVTFGNFDLSFMFQGSHGAEVRNMGDQYLYNHFNSRQDYDPAVTPDQEFIQQKIFTNSIVQDASYIALRNVNLGYNLPAAWASKVGMTSARLYVSGSNLMYLKASDYTGFNPESLTTTSPTTYGYQRAGAPIPRSVVTGVIIEF
ncbi:SusC/RagA family TonB-linked outer membrane protein [Reichenbachiella sp.]|uniref:SusC/RagA family TonB-linked outer membrane protein n=1 Tax=Reichenbachiella sp. TaxID=2184521 RepID=UPI003BAFF840